MSRSAIVVGAGIVGLATARALAQKGFQVTVIERTEKAVGASIRNFGMIWPIGQPDGPLYNRAIRSREIWKETADAAGIWYAENGSLHIAQHEDEWTVLKELYEAFNTSGREVSLIDPGEIDNRFDGVNTKTTLGGLYSATEMVVDPRQAISKLPAYLEERLSVRFIWGKQVREVREGKVQFGDESLQADIICICSGADFETLYPQPFEKVGITKCKLQMMRFISAEQNFRIGTSVCGGLSLAHYKSFTAAASLPALRRRYESEMAEYMKWGIHVMVSQNERGELTVGDSHEYGHTFDPFDRSYVNDLIKTYLNEFMQSRNWKLVESWNGIYPKMAGESDLILNPDPNVYIINGLAGAGMTLSFGLAEEVVRSFK